MFAKFDQNTFEGFFPIIFTRLFLYFPIMTLTPDLENQYGSSSNHKQDLGQV